MKIITLALGLMLLTVAVYAQPTPTGISDYQMKARAPWDVRQLLVNNLDPLSPKYGQAMWLLASDVISEDLETNLDLEASQDGDNVELYLSYLGSVFGWGVKLIPGEGLSLTQGAVGDQETITIELTPGDDPDGDFAFYELGTPNPVPDPLTDAERSGYTLFNGLNGGLATMIEILESGYINLKNDGFIDDTRYLFKADANQVGNSDAFAITQGSFTNGFGARRNHTYSWGVNPLLTGSDTAFFYNLEAFFSPAFGENYAEAHLVRCIAGDCYRVFSFTLDNALANWNQYTTVDSWTLRSPAYSGGPNYVTFNHSDNENTLFKLTGSLTGESVGFTWNTASDLLTLNALDGTPATAIFWSNVGATYANRMRVIDDWGTFQGSDGIATQLWGSEAVVGGGMVRVDLGDGLDFDGNILEVDPSELVFGGDHDWYEVGGTSPPNAITDNMFHTGNVAIGALTARGLLDVDHIYIGVAGASHGYVRSADGIYLNTDYDNNGGDGSFHIQNSGTDRLEIEDGGDVVLSAYPNTRDDGSPVNVLGTTAGGKIQSFPVADVSGGAADGNGIFDASNEGATTAVVIANVPDDGFYFQDLDGTGFLGYEPGTTGVNIVDADDRPALTVQNIGAFDAEINIDNEITLGTNVGGDYIITDLGSSVIPFKIENATTVNNTLKLEADGDLLAADYPNTRDDGTPVNVLGTNGSGLIQSYPVTDLADGDGNSTNEIQDITVTGGAQPFTLDLSGDLTDATITGAGINVVTRSGNDLTITGTEVDGNASNELQTLSASGSTTTYGINLSNSGGTVNLIEGTNVTIDRTGDDLTINAALAGGAMSSWLLAASGTGGTESITDGETVTIAAGTGITATRSTNTVTIASTVVDTDTDDQNLTIDGSGPDYTVAINDGTDVIIAAGANVTLSEAVANTLTVAVTTEAIQDAAGALVAPGNTETGIAVTYDDAGNMLDFVVDFAASNWTADADAGATEAISNQTLLFEGGAGIVTTYTSGTPDEVNFTVDGDEFTTITTPESDDYILLHDENGAGADVLEKLLYPDFNALIVDQLSWTIDADAGGTELIGDQTILFAGASGVSTSYDAGTNTLTITGSGSSSDHDWYEVGGTSPPNNIDDAMFSGTGNHGIGTTSPDNLLELGTTSANGAFMSFETTSASTSAVLGRVQFDQSANSALAEFYAQKSGAGTNDAELTFGMKNNGGTAEKGLQIDYETGTVPDNPRIRMFGGLTNNNWIDIPSTTTLDDGYFGARIISSGVTITLPTLTNTNNDDLGTILVIYNTSSGDITIDPGSNSGSNVDTVNGSTSNITLPTKQSRIFICTNIDAFGAQDWISFN